MTIETLSLTMPSWIELISPFSSFLSTTTTWEMGSLEELGCRTGWLRNDPFLVHSQSRSTRLRSQI
jgi:hypothetical protein